MAVSEELVERLEYLNLGTEDRALLRRLRPMLEKHADAFVAAFYRHLLSFESTRERLRDPEVKERLLAKQREYLLGLADARFDDEYVARRRAIGEVHERLGLEPRWYLGAYALYFSLLTPLICEAHNADPDHGVAAVSALQKLLMLDAQIAMESYVLATGRQLEFLTRELSEQSRRLARDYDDQSRELRRSHEDVRAAGVLASIATLVAGLAHEIGTPMGVIQGHAKLLESAVTDESARWRLETIKSQVGRISRIIQMLLGMAKPHSTRRLPVSLEPLLETMLSFVAEKMVRHGIEVERRFEPVPTIEADPERLQQLLLNLLLNAADAMPEGGELRVALSQSPDAVEIGVWDTGIGIPEDDLDRIFDPFFTTKSAGEGNGLGLMVCRSIAADHGGTISVRSRAGGPTEFLVRLPLPQG